MLPRLHVPRFSLNIAYFLVSVVVVLSTSSHCLAKVCQGIVPFHSSIADIDASLGYQLRYSDVEEGFHFTGHGRANGGCVLNIGYLRGTADPYLSCLESLNTQTQSIPVFEQYGGISPDSEKAILDNFAIQLLDNQDLTGYVVLRRGQHSQQFVARKLRYIRNYLTKRRGVPASRVSAFEGKPRRDFSVELYLVSKGKPGPTGTSGSSSHLGSWAP